MVKIGDVWDRTVEFLGDNLGFILPIAILALFIPTSIIGSLAELARTGTPSTKLVLQVLSLGFSILSLWAQLAIVALAVDPALGRNATRVATARLLPAIGVILLLFVAAIIPIVPVALIMGAAGVDIRLLAAGLATLAIAPALSWTILAYMFGMMLVLLLVGARLAPLTGVLVAERRGIGAIVRAVGLTRGMTWRLVGVFLLYFIVVSVAMLATRLVFGSVLAIFSNSDGPVTVANVVTSVVVAALSTTFTALASAFCGKLYAAIIGARGVDAAAASFLNERAEA